MNRRLIVAIGCRVLIAAVFLAAGLPKILDPAGFSLSVFRYQMLPDDLINLMAAIPTYAKRGSSWVCSPAAMEVVFNAIRIAAGGNTMDILTASAQQTFLGYPIEITDVYPDNVTANYNGAVMIGFGNLQQAATLGTRREVRMALSSDRYFELDQIGVKGTLRHDINVHDLGSDTVKSPFCVLTGAT